MRETDLHQLLANTADAAFVVGPDCLIRYWNSAAEDLFELRASNAVGRPCCSVVQGREQTGAPVCTPDCAVLAGNPRCGAAPAFDMLVNTAKAESHWVNVTTLYAETYRGERLVVHLVRDVDARKRLETVTRSFLAQIAGLSGEKIEDLLQPAPTPHERLTLREKEITRHLAQGQGTSAIAQALGLSPATVRNHVRNILAKLAVHSRTEAVLRAIREKLI